MKTVVVKKIDSPVSAEMVSALMDGRQSHRIGCVNWPDDYPYAPDVSFVILHDGDRIYLRYSVDEQSVAAVAQHDNGAVWCDSCVEFFVSFDRESYYNIEVNAAGRLLLSHRLADGSDKCFADTHILSSIVRVPSLGSEPFAERVEHTSWSLLLVIPKEAFFKDDISSLSGVEATANFYNCGDKQQEPPVLSGRPIDNATPNFTMPRFFGHLIFE